MPRLGLPGRPPAPSCLQSIVESLGCPSLALPDPQLHLTSRGWPWPCPEVCADLAAGQRWKRGLQSGARSASPLPAPRTRVGWGHVLIILSPWVAEEGHPCGVGQEPESFLREAGPPESPSCLGPCYCLLPGEQGWLWLVAAALRSLTDNPQAGQGCASPSMCPAALGLWHAHLLPHPSSFFLPPHATFPAPLMAHELA